MSKDGQEKPRNALESTTDLLGLDSTSPEIAESGRQLAQTVNTLATFVNVTLLPIAAVNFAYRKAREYFEERFGDDLQEYAKDIPEQAIVEPRPSIAEPLLRGIAFSLEESDLKEMYLKLLAAELDGRKNHMVHPSFVEIIRQLSSSEARALKDIWAHKTNLPVVRLNAAVKDHPTSEREWFKNVVNVLKYGSHQEEEVKRLSSMLENLERLGLVTIDYSRYISEDSAYDWVRTHEAHQLLNLNLATEDRYEEIKIDKGILFLTDFGKLFADAVIGEV